MNHLLSESINIETCQGVEIRAGYRLWKLYRGIPRYSSMYHGTYRGIPQVPSSKYSYLYLINIS